MDTVTPGLSGQKNLENYHVTLKLSTRTERKLDCLEEGGSYRDRAVFRSNRLPHHNNKYGLRDR